MITSNGLAGVTREFVAQRLSPGGAADTLYFAFGAPKVREADASVGGIRMLAIPDSPESLAESRKRFPYGYLTQVMPIPAFIGVTRPMKCYTFDYMLFATRG